MNLSFTSARHAQPRPLGLANVHPTGLLRNWRDKMKALDLCAWLLVSHIGLRGYRGTHPRPDRAMRTAVIAEAMARICNAAWREKARFHVSGLAERRSSPGYGRALYLDRAHLGTPLGSARKNSQALRPPPALPPPRLRITVHTSQTPEPLHAPRWSPPAPPRTRPARRTG